MVVFFATARTTDQGIPGGRWRMRMIGSLSPLPKPDPSNPNKSELNSNFKCIEEKDYYLPNPKNIILRSVWNICICFRLWVCPSVSTIILCTRSES